MPNDGYRIYTEVRDGVKYGIDVQNDVYKVLGLARQSGGYDAVYACCNEHGKIAPFAKFKPIRGGGIDTEDDTWQGGVAHKCGFDIPEYANVGSLNNQLIQALVSGEAQWKYLAPRPNVDWSRITDFDGYNHRARDPFPKVIGGAVEKLKNGRIQIPIRHGTTQANGNLTIADFKIRGFVLTEWYLGVVLWSSSRAYYAISENKGLNDTVFELDSVPVGEYKATTFLSNGPTLAGQPTLGIYISSGMISVANVEVTAYVPPQYAAVYGALMQYGGNIVTYSFTIYNTTSLPFVFTNLRLSVYQKSTTHGDMGVGIEKFGDVTVDGESSKYYTGKVSILTELPVPGVEQKQLYIRLYWSDIASSDEEAVMMPRPDIE